MKLAKSTTAKVVLLFAKPRFHSHRERIGGVYTAALKRGWQVQHISELTGLGLGNFAFLGDTAKPYWSEGRGAFFKEALPNGSKFSRYAGPDPNTVDGRKALGKWLRSLPLPCGCFLAADHLAAAFYDAAHKAGLKIGSDLPALGVDNDECCCMSVTPTLSSIKMDFFQSGVDSFHTFKGMRHQNAVAHSSPALIAFIVGRP